MARVLLAALVALLILSFGSWRAAGQTPEQQQLLDSIRSGLGAIGVDVDALEQTLIEVPPPVNTPPVAAFAVDPKPCVVGEICRLTNLSSDADGDVLTSTWTVNGLTATQTDIDVAFAGAGTFAAFLDVTDGTDSSRASSNIEVVDPAPPPLPPTGSALADCVASLAKNTLSNCGMPPFQDVFLSRSEVAAITGNDQAWLRSGSPCSISAWVDGEIGTGSLLFFGGGHKCSAVNTIYGLGLESLVASVLSRPSTVTGYNGAIDYRWYPGSDPAPVIGVPSREGSGLPPNHTYGAAAYDTLRNRLCFGGGYRPALRSSGAYGASDPRPGMQGGEPFGCYSFDVNRWTFWGMGAQGDNTATLTYDELHDVFYARRRRAIVTYDASFNETGRVSLPSIQSEGAAVIGKGSDGKRYLISAYQSEKKTQISWHEIAGSGALVNYQRRGTTFRKQAGMDWDSRRGRVIFWTGYAGSLETFDPVTGSVGSIGLSLASGTVKPTGPSPDNGDNGCFGRTRYYAPRDVVVAVCDYTKPPYVIWLGGGPEGPDPLPPPPPPAPPPETGDVGRPADLPLPGDAAGRVCDDRPAHEDPDCPSLQLLVSNAAAGSTIVLPKGLYRQCANVQTAGLTIDFQGSDITGLCAGKAVIIQNAPNLTLKNMACDAPGNHGGNLACIRRQANGLTLENVYFRNGDEGILGGSGLGGPVTIVNSRFENLGGDNGHSHLAYMAGVDNLLIDHSEFRCPVQGHALKIGARSATITNNIIDSSRCAQAPNSSPSSREIDNFAGGGLTLQNNIITKYDKSDQVDMIGYAPGGQYNSSLQPRFVTLEDNVFNCGRDPTIVLRIGHGSPAVTASGNTYNGNCDVAATGGN